MCTISNLQCQYNMGPPACLEHELTWLLKLYIPLSGQLLTCLITAWAPHSAGRGGGRGVTSLPAGFRVYSVYWGTVILGLYRDYIGVMLGLARRVCQGIQEEQSVSELANVIVRAVSKASVSCMETHRKRPLNWAPYVGLKPAASKSCTAPKLLEFFVFFSHLCQYYGNASLCIALDQAKHIEHGAYV